MTTSVSSGFVDFEISLNFIFAATVFQNNSFIFLNLFNVFFSPLFVGLDISLLLQMSTLVENTHL
jgi:hypothetical protein